MVQHSFKEIQWKTCIIHVSVHSFCVNLVYLLFNDLGYLLELKSTCSEAGWRSEYLTSNSLLLTPFRALAGEVVSLDGDSGDCTWTINDKGEWTVLYNHGWNSKRILEQTKQNSKGPTDFLCKHWHLERLVSSVLMMLMCGHFWSVSFQFEDHLSRNDLSRSKTWHSGNNSSMVSKKLADKGWIRKVSYRRRCDSWDSFGQSVDVYMALPVDDLLLKILVYIGGLI